MDVYDMNLYGTQSVSQTLGAVHYVYECIVLCTWCVLYFLFSCIYTYSIIHMQIELTILYGLQLLQHSNFITRPSFIQSVIHTFIFI